MPEKDFPIKVWNEIPVKYHGAYLVPIQKATNDAFDELKAN